MQCQTIDTAPQDGTEILACNANQGCVTSLISWDRVHDRWKMKGMPILHLQATHWVRIPKKPSRTTLKPFTMTEDESLANL